MSTTALQSEEALLARIRKQQLIESIDHMSPVYLEGIKRILTVSADTELISAPAYFHAAVHAPSLHAFGSAISIIQDELGHAHIAYRLLRNLGVDWCGFPDNLKQHGEHLDYGFKGHSNDSLRQIWMSSAVPLCNELHLNVPAHYDEAQKKYVIDYPFPAHFDA